MGGVGAGVCATYVLRNGIRACLHSKPKYDRLLQATGAAFYMQPINGVLSHNAASADTHARYGAVDFEGDGYSRLVLNTVARQFRDELILAYPRLWTGNWHIHAADADCPNMSAALAAQFILFGRGYDALVGNNPDPLGGYKRAEIMAAFTHKPAPITPPAPRPAGTVPVKSYNFPYTYKPGWYPYPGPQGKSYYGPSKAGNPWYSGKVGGGTGVGATATGGLSLPWIRGHIARIQRCVGTAADGRYGAVTVTAVQRWQKAHRLTADGIVGPKTWAAMAKSKGQ